jgi:hypothetical protein
MGKPYLLLGLFFFLPSARGSAQTEDSSRVFKISGYVDAYYAYYTDSVGPGNYQKFPSVSPRSKEFGLNTAMITAEYTAERVRGIVTLQYGDIPKSAWSTTFNNILEAHAGIRLCKKLWLDAGFFRSHFGTEGLLPKENFVSSIAISTYFEPFYEAGARLNYVPDDKWSISLYGLNGYNLYEDNNFKKSIGMLITRTLGANGNIGYSNYLGDDNQVQSDVSLFRFHNNIFYNQLFGHLKVQLGADYCLQSNSSLEDPGHSASMYSGEASFKYLFTDKFALAARGEVFHDPNGYMGGLIENTDNEFTGLKMWGVTLGAEFKPTENSYLRIEGRQIQFDNKQQLFYWDGENKSNRLELSANVGVSF